MCVCAKLLQSCLTLCDPVDSSPPDSSVHGILQARILEWVAISFSRGSSQPRDRTRVSCIGGRRFNLWATKSLPSWPSLPFHASTLSHPSGLLQSLSFNCLHVIFLSYWKDSGYFLLLGVPLLAGLVTPDLSYLLRPLPHLKLQKKKKKKHYCFLTLLSYCPASLLES